MHWNMKNFLGWFLSTKHTRRMHSQLRLFWLLFYGYTLLSYQFGYAEKAPNYSFVRAATSAPLVMAYDYIVVGGGTSGCSLAATLSEGGHVLVLERGGSPYGNKDIERVDTFANNLANLSPSSPAQQFISEDGVINARARVLGGGSAINAGFYTRASPSYVSQAGWDGALVNSSYSWVERKVAFQPPMLQFQSAVREGLLEAGVRPYNGFTYEHIYGTKVGATIFDRAGKRHTAADLLEYANPRKTRVYLHATVDKVLFRVTRYERRPRAIGVLFRDTNGVVHRAFLRRGGSNEVILSAGAIGSPQLLMLSGVGPAEELRVHGIDVILNQPLVGQGMADNPMNALFVPSPSPVETSLIQVVGITDFDSYIEAASGSTFARAFAQNLPQLTQVQPPQQNNQSTHMGMVEEEKTAADIAKAYNFIYSLINGTLRAGLILEKTMGPKSKGHLRLRSRDSYENPSVTFNYFQEPEDLIRCVKGMETIVKVINSNSFAGFRYPVDIQGLFIQMTNLPLNLRPRHFDSAFNMEHFCRDTVMTIWHYHGGCQVGKVVDKDYRVIGVDRLRVVDGSTYHDSPGTNPQATCMMLGRYMGRRILDARRGR